MLQVGEWAIHPQSFHYGKLLGHVKNFGYAPVSEDGYNLSRDISNNTVRGRLSDSLLL